MGSPHRPPIQIPTDETVLAYLAGLIDADGDISIGLNRRMERLKHPSYNLRVQLTNTDLELMDWLVETLGGAVHSADRHERRKTIYMWKIHGQNAEDLLQAIEPFMRIKRKRAEVALRFRSLGSPWKASDKEILANEREKLRQELSVLNRRGVRNI